MRIMTIDRLASSPSTLLFLFALLFLLLLVGLEGIDGAAVVVGEEEEKGGGHDDESLNFLALGDWGGAPLIGSLPDQRKTAVGMGQVAKELDAKFVIALGDNFYRTGVSTVASKRFDMTFESVYTESSLLTIPWYVIGGNHDHHGNIDAQIRYTYNTKYNINQRWNFPSLYHSHSFTTSTNKNKKEEGVTVDLILIDTVDLCSLHELDDEEEEGYFDPLPYLPKSHAKEQWSWLEEQLSKSTADYLLVGGHYPVFSICSHGPTETLVRHLRPLLLKHGAHYLAGHDHCMNHFVDDDTHNQVHYVLTGTGIGCCARGNNLHHPLNEHALLQWHMTNEINGSWIPYRKKVAKGGFASFSATTKHMKITYHNHNGDPLYQVPPISPRLKPSSTTNHPHDKQSLPTDIQIE
jgi:tartrate-resistant acid phosphatase type 5